MQKGNHNPRTEEMISVINELQQAHKIANEQLRKSQAEMEALKKELDELNMEKADLEEILSMKQDTLDILQQHYKEQENKIQRQQAVWQDSIGRVTHLNSKIQEEKRRRRKQRMEFELQLEELIEKHKALWRLHTPELLAQEINSTASSKEQLLKEEKLILEKLDAIERQVTGQLHSKAEAMAVDSVAAFLCSEEAAAAMHLFEEENKKAVQFLEVASQHYQLLQHKYHRLKMELEAGGQGGITGPRGSPTAGASEVVSGVVAEGALAEPVVEPPTAWEKELNIDHSPGKHPTGQASVLS
ncbi:synaptonemal complex central element protein 1-like isoform X2 [Notamacropus eugenii]